jgi:hypothetical protein
VTAQRLRPVAPPQDRHRAVAELDVLIAQAEAALADYRGDMERTEAAGGENRSIRGRMRMAEERLAQLRRSRRVLVEGDEGRSSG